MRSLGVSLFAATILWCAGAAVVQNVPQIIYDRSPKLRIKGEGFTGDETQIHLTFYPKLVKDKDYTLTVQSENVLLLELLDGRRWLDVGSRVNPISLKLVEYKDDSDSEAGADFQEVIVASVIATPEVEESDQIIYRTVTSYLYINGTGFGSGKVFKPYFDPPLYLGIDYEVLSTEPTRAVLALRPNSFWREEPGPLYLKGLDTGGGPLRLGGDDGLLVAEVQADLDLHGVSVDTNEDKIYQATAEIVITGSGFSEELDANKLRFSNGILNDVNYTVTEASSTELTLRLAPGSLWRKNGDNLPGPLTLLAVDAGAGFVAVGPNNAKKGRVVATVYETPAVSPSHIKLSRTHSHELNIFGSGFPVRAGRDLELEFSPTLDRDIDYELSVIDRNQIQLQLLDGKAWRTSAGPLKLMYISTIGPTGRIPLNGNKGIQVAEIIEDTSPGETGGVNVLPAQQKVYQSVLHETITISGEGFKQNVKLNFKPELTAGVDYDLQFKDSKTLVLSLRNNKLWASSPGPLSLMSITVDGTKYDLARGNGIRVATVLADPSIEADQGSLHETQSKSLWIRGSGFTDVESMSVKLSLTPQSAFQIVMVVPDALRILLNEGQSWYPTFATAGDEKVALTVTAIDTGAGEVELEKPVTVAYIVPDREGVECDDSCEFAFDGICDDSSATKEPDWGWGLDDDYGGYYDDYYGNYYDDYYMDDEYSIAACLPGTDCTDCGGVDVIDEKSSVVCDNTCTFPRDGVCDDPRGGNYCPLGTDCQDCGPVGATNFTMIDDDTWFDDDDDQWNDQDLPEDFFRQADGYHANKHRIRSTNVEPIGPAGMFITVLEGLVYTTGAVILVIASWLGYRWYHGYSIPFIDAFNPQFSTESELARKMTVTPDVIRT